MHPGTEGIIYVVDDDPGVRDALAWLLRSRYLVSESFTSAEAFLLRFGAQLTADFVPNQPGCLLLDVRMPGLSGLALFDHWLQLGLVDVLPVIFLTGHADVPMAVSSVKRGAFDFFTKPFSDNALVDRCVQALAHSSEQLKRRHNKVLVQRQMSELTEREIEVMRCVVEGLPNKLIADRLQISVRTVEVHRARVFDKMHVRSAVELANEMRKIQP